MVEHHVDIVGVVGSIPTVPTNKLLSFLNHSYKNQLVMKKINKIREAKLNKIRFRKNNIRKVKVD